jgi:hypothetical protein
MNSCILLSLAALLFWPRSMAQQPNMRLWLNTGTEEQRIQRLVALGVEPETADHATSSIEPMVLWWSVRSESRQQYAILFLPCSFDSAHLYLMQGTGEDWHTSDRVEFDCHYDNSVSVDISPIRRPTVDDVLVHHVSEGHGTGFSQQNFKVLLVSEGKLKIVLDTEEVLSVSHVPVGSYDLLQRSTFVTIPSVRSHSRVIEETRSTTLNGNLTVQRRHFRWAPSTNRYVPSKFSSVEAGDN